MQIEELEKLPTEISDYIFSAKFVDFNTELQQKYSLNPAQFSFVMDLEDSLILKKISALDLPAYLEKMEFAKQKDLRAIALDMASVLLWPIQDYLANVDRLILRLGGKVPAHQFLKSDVQAKTFPEHTKGMVRQLLSEYEDFKDLRLSGKKIYNNDGRLLMPSVDNWLKDYVHFLGAGYHNSLQRSQYLAKAPNALELSNEERESLRNILLSYDDNVVLSWHYADGLLMVELPTNHDESSDKKIDLELAVKNLEAHLKQIETVVLPTDFIMSEAQSDIFKLRDVLWQALGVQDRTKILTCLKVLVEKKVLDTMLTEDNRFRNILKRFVTVRYGNALSLWLENNQDKLISRRLFLEMVLEEKMKLTEDESTVAAFYLTNIWPKSGQVVYLDQQDGVLKWRGLQVINNQLVWIE